MTGEKDIPDPEKTRKLSAVSVGITVATGIIWALWDIVPAMWEGRNDTISENIRNFSRFAWVVPWFWGALTAHFFINIGQPDSYKLRFLIFGVTTVALVVFNLLTYYVWHWNCPPWVRTISVFVGALCGLLFWSQDN